jgi:hypothetical protein
LDTKERAGALRTTVKRIVPDVKIINQPINANKRRAQGEK